MLPYDQLRLVMAKLRFADETALRTIGLAKLAKKYDAYPLVEGGRRLYCLLPKGMNMSQARQLSAGAASQTIIVLQEGQRGFAKVWPLGEGAAAQAASAPVEMQAAVGAPMPQPAGDKEPDGPVGDLEIVEE